MIEAWIGAFSRMTYGIYVLTAAEKENINGMIASWVSQISYDPALIMAAVHPHRYTHQFIQQSGAFALHILGKEQSECLGRFKGADPRAKFDSLEWQAGKTGSPILKDCVAWLECRLRESFTPGNHTVFIGEVIAAAVNDDRQVLTSCDYDGVYLGKA